MSGDATPHPSSLTLDRLMHGALSPEEEQPLRAHLNTCPACAARLEESSSSAEHFLKVVQQRTQEKMRKRMEEQQPPKLLARPAVRLGLLGLCALVLVAAGALLFFGR